MAIIKKHDFVEIEYTGRIREDNSIFDTTEEKVAKENNAYDEHSDYGALVICVGENHLPKALEEQLVGKETGKDYRIEIAHEDAFGKKEARLIQMIPLNKFRQQKIQPFPGLQLNIDGMFGIVRTVSGGRCLVDFNHPLAGKDLAYEVKEGIASITLKRGLPKEAQQEFQKIAERTVPSIKSVSFTISEEKKK